MPARARDVIRALAGFGVEVERPRAGSHWKCKKPGYGTFPLPLHNGDRTELADVYIRALCRNFEIDETDLRARL